MYTWAIETCNAPRVGYSQKYRNQQEVKGITYYDCSSFIFYALRAGGENLSGWPFTTYTMISKLLELGWKEIDASGEILSGDIGWRPGHTEICYSGGVGAAVFMGAHTANALLVNQVSIGSSGGDPEYKSKWQRLFRYGNGGAGSFGYSLPVIAAICGNWWSESNINPGIYEGLHVVDLTDNNQYGGYGLGQWTNTSSGVHRRTQLILWVREKGYTDDSPQGQIAYFIFENYWQKISEFPEFTNLNDFLNTKITDLGRLTEAFMLSWEGIHGDLRNRIERAEKCAIYIQENAQNTKINQWIIGNKYLSENEILNNAVMLYRNLSAGGGGGGTIIKKRNKMPLWMYIKYY